MHASLLTLLAGATSALAAVRGFNYANQGTNLPAVTVKQD